MVDVLERFTGLRSRSSLSFRRRVAVPTRSSRAVAWLPRPVVLPPSTGESLRASSIVSVVIVSVVPSLCTWGSMGWPAGPPRLEGRILSGVEGPPDQAGVGRRNDSGPALIGWDEVGIGVGIDRSPAPGRWKRCPRCGHCGAPRQSRTAPAATSPPAAADRSARPGGAGEAELLTRLTCRKRERTTASLGGCRDRPTPPPPPPSARAGSPLLGGRSRPGRG